MRTQVGAKVTNVIPMPLHEKIARVDMLQADETLRATVIATHACYKAGTALEDQAPRAKQRWIAAAAALFRSQFAAWRQAGYEHAAEVLYAAIATGETGVVFQGLPKARQREIARMLAQSAVTAYNGILTGETPLQPGRYLSIVQACEEE